MKIVNCPEGHEAEVLLSRVGTPGSFVQCKPTSQCWTGPTRETEAEAIEAWNLVMDLYECATTLRFLHRDQK